MDSNKDSEVVYLKLEDIIPNKFQPREMFDETGLEELSESIKEHGVIQPVIVRPSGDKYELIAGERRCKASSLAGLTTVPAIIRNMDDRESAKVSLLENLQRRNLSPIEEARTYKRILELDNMTQDSLAKTMGKSQPAIANKLRLLGLPEEVQDALMKNQISERHARSLLNLKDKEQQLMMLDRIRNERLTVRELDAEIKKLKESNQDNSNDEETNNDANGGEEAMPQNMMNDNNPNMNNNNNNTYMNMNTNNEMPMNNFGQFGNNPQNSMPSYQSNFGGMGLNDYQSSINGGMFNNIPGQVNMQPNNNFQGEFSNQFNSPAPNPFENQNNQPENNFNPMNNNSNLNMSNTDNMLNSAPQGNNYNSLGSMFDGTNNNQNNNNNPTNDFSGSGEPSPFISQIRENTLQPKENQFLPNFDTPNNFSNNQTGINDTPMNNFSSQEQDFGMNSFINQNNFDSNPNDYSANNNVNTMNNVVGMDNFNNTPINDFSFPNQNNNNFSAINFNANQGGLFNQPLNIVNVPNNNNNTNSNNNNDDSNKNNNDNNNIINNNEPPKKDSIYNEQPEEEPKEEKEQDDNPFDDEYKDILNAKPVSVQKEETEEKEQEKESEPTEDKEVEAPKEEEEDEVEVIGADIQSEEKSSSDEVKEEQSKNDYIVLDPVKTIYDARGAVYELKKTTDAIKQNNINIDTEEIEFDDYYQITIKIKK